ncbi:SPOR domain-containing protein [Dasania marina]|uniref:SPOR domain-containing protein n=1 Tax=Dasania marina TaxID=471499 RepID=UPI0030D893F8|tara:strand:+ start:2147 stop:2845 length:699 start_codon:yes stop_codon:yes gene_type:complete
MRWFFALLLIANGIYFFFQAYMVQPVARTMQVNTEQLDLGQPVVLLAEHTPEQLPTQETGSAEEPVVAASPLCWMLGAFKEQVSAKQMQGRLAALEINFAIKVFEVAGKPDYWVHIPPQPSRKLAVKLLRELQLKKIDSFLITEGDLANGISLGLFTEQKRAEKLYDLRKKQGLEVSLKEVPRVYTEIWLVSEQGEYAKFSEPLWEKIKQGQGGIERRRNYCNKIASPENID